MKKQWTNKDNLELSIKELTKILHTLGNVNLFTNLYSIYHKKDNQKKVQDAYSIAFELRNRLQKRLENLEDEDV